MNEIAARIRDYDNCHDGDIDTAADEIDRLEKVIDDQRKELDARETILNEIQEVCGSGWWTGSIDFIRNLKEEVKQKNEAIESMKFEVNDLEKIIEYQNGFIESMKEEIKQLEDDIAYEDGEFTGTP